ncbi:hypothetical protein ACVW0I_000910 [Bradyrhizobium sp. LM6.11]
MRPANSSTTSWLAAAAFAAVMTISGGCLAAQSAPDSENGRYSMTPIPEGVLRLDNPHRHGIDLYPERRRLGLLRGARRADRARRRDRPAPG